MFNHYSKYHSECNTLVFGDTDIRCGATIFAPSLTPHFTEDRAFSCFAMECEGEFPQDINIVIDSDEDLTLEEVVYIMEKVSELL